MTALTYGEACDAHAKAQGLLEPFQKLRQIFPPGTVHLDQTGGFVMLVRVQLGGTEDCDDPNSGPYVWISAEYAEEPGTYVVCRYESHREEDSYPTVEVYDISLSALPEMCMYLLQKGKS